MRRSVGTALLPGWLALSLSLPVVAEPYVDKVLDDGPQPILVMSQELARSSGWQRGWRFEYNIARETAGARSSSQGIALSGFLDTPNYGALSISAALNRTGQSDGGVSRTGTGALGLWRIDQVGLPLDGGWSANHSAGALATLSPEIARGFGRIGLPSSPIEGVNAEYRLAGRSSINASLGQPGLYSGLGVNGFEASRGRLASLGGQQALAALPGISSIAMQAFEASGIGDAGTGSAGQNARGLWSGWRWEGAAPWSDGVVAPGNMPVWQRQGGLQLQVNVIASQSSSDSVSGTTASANARGGWLDAQWRSPWMQQAAGAFYLQPNLRWGTYNAVSDLRGAYWRGDIASRRWQVTASAEVTESVSGINGRNLFTNLSTRYRLDTRNTAFGSLSVRRINNSGASMQLGWEHQSEWGQTQWLMDLLHAASRRSARVGIDHSFRLGSESALALSAALERIRNNDLETRAVSWGIVGSTRPWSTVTLDANLRGVQGANSSQLIGNVGVTWAIDPRWSLAAQFSAIHGEDPQTFALVSSLTQASLTATPVVSARRVQLTLRYEDRAGTAVAPLGGPPGSGAGTLRGVVFYDADNNGRRDASEAGVPNVVVVLDRRFVTRTDAQGRYEFPWVVAGEHVVQLQTDNIPLPWNPLQRDALPISVLVRATTSTDFALQRER